MALSKECLYELYIVQNKYQRQIAEELGVTEATVDYWTRKYGLTIKKSNPDAVFNLQHIDKADPIFCYYAGLVATDGYLDYKNKRIALRVTNEGCSDVFEAIRNYFGFVRPLRCYTRNTAKLPAYELLIPNSCIFKELESMGIYGKKVERSFDINWLLSADEDCQRMFLRGVLDGDGSIAKNNFRISMTSKDFISNIITFTSSLLDKKVSMSYSSNQWGKKYPQMYLSSIDTFNFCSFIYAGFEQYRFLDKYNKFLKLKESHKIKI